MCIFKMRDYLEDPGSLRLLVAAIFFQILLNSNPLEESAILKVAQKTRNRGALN